MKVCPQHTTVTPSVSAVISEASACSSPSPQGVWTSSSSSAAVPDRVACIRRALAASGSPNAGAISRVGAPTPLGSDPFGANSRARAPARCQPRGTSPNSSRTPSASIPKGGWMPGISAWRMRTIVWLGVRGMVKRVALLRPPWVVACAATRPRVPTRAPQRRPEPPPAGPRARLKPRRPRPPRRRAAARRTGTAPRWPPTTAASRARASGSLDGARTSWFGVDDEVPAQLPLPPPRIGLRGHAVSQRPRARARWALVETR